MANANFFKALAKAFADKKARPFLINDDGLDVTYADMAKRASEAAGRLVACGLTPGNRLLVQVEKSVENIALYLGAMQAGIVYVPLNTSYTDEEVAYFIDDADPGLIICAPSRADGIRSIAARRKIETLASDGTGSFMDVAPTSEAPDICHKSGDDIAVILYTSGTTGRSKGAMLTHANLETNARALCDLWEITDQDTLLHALPIFHIHGLFVALHTTMLRGARVYFQAKFDADAVINALAACTLMMGVPTMYSRLLAHPRFDASCISNMRLFISGSAPLSEETFSTFKARTGHSILERYGMSEAGMITSNPYGGARVADTVGYPLPGVSVRIASTTPDTPGEVEIKGPGVFSGYWRNRKKTMAAFTADGWFKTGDVGILSDDGRLSLVGREKDLIIVGGFNVYPKEVEAALDAHPAIAESAIVAAPHQDMGEGVAAFLVGENQVRPSDAELHKHLATLAAFKRPRVFRWLDALPRNAMGKVQKHVLRTKVRDVFQTVK